ncbi:Re/Si-specific NAD(P)(+) transhydrogenase subunit alpha [Thermoleophilum album]|uniref:NAD(P) transhydrogenase subunit alpha part 1 n=1 Tax=Thermoleophilum album TaxID=29539 RepID=A0A1H6FKN6_THEAL|nr:Re/Si-specific NAD(P)(+) transhydrogenase subunit alpha [Thermoleophilum album]SEH10403.1 NAD(P) transhydrogenase subunit alpha [Thermoleophilum album]
MRVSVPRETAAGERRVALVPDVVARLTKGGLEVVVEPGAGAAAHHSDDEYREAGAKVEEGAGLAGDLVAKVQPPSIDEVSKLREGAVLVGFLQPFTSPDLVRALAQRRVTALAMEAIPRITRAQTMDALSSQATVAGYQAALIAARELPRFFPMLTTAAGTIRPAKVLVLGAGVAGLQAIATARRLGAIVFGYDVRAAVREQIESLGARFLEIDLGIEDAEAQGGYARPLTEEEEARQRQLLADAIAGVDCVISTAAVPGRRAPLLIIEDAVERMPAGSVIVDLAAETGGNCELTKAGETVEAHGVKVIGPVNLPASMPDHASQLYARNLQALIELITEDGQLALDFDDEIVAGCCITHDGEVVNERVRQAIGAPAS